MKTLGELAVRLSAKTQGFTSAIDAALKKVDEFADEVEEVASKGAAALGDLSDGFLTVAAAATGAFILGAQGNKQMADASKELQDATRALAVEFGKDLVPLVKEITTLVKTAAATYRNLSAGQREAIVSGVKWAFIIGTGAKALERSIMFGKSFFEGTVAISRAMGPMAQASQRGFDAVTRGAASAGAAITALGKTSVGDLGAKFSGAAKGLSAAFSALPGVVAGLSASFAGMLPAIGAVLAPVAAVAAAVGALVVLAAVLRDAWAQSGDGISAWFRELAADAVDLGQSISAFMGRMFTSFVDFVSKGAEVVLEAIAAKVRLVASLAAKAAKWAGAEDIADLFTDISKVTGADIVKNLRAGGEALWEAGKGAALMAGDKIVAAGERAGEALKAGARAGADILGTAVDSAKRGFALLDKDLGLSSMLGRLSPSLPQVGDPSTVKGVGTLDDAAKKATEHAKFAEQALKSVREVTAGLLDAALLEKSLYEKRLAHLSEATGAVFERLFNVDLKAPLEKFKQQVDSITQSVQQAREGLTQKVTGRSGNVMGVVESGVQGAALGGPLGAIIAIVVDLLTQSEAFASVVEMVNGAIQQVADTLGTVLSAVGPIIAAGLSVATALVSGLEPALSALGSVLEPIAPVIMLVSTMLAPLFSMLGEMVSVLAVPLRFLVDVALGTLFEALKAAGLVVMHVVLGIREAWNGIAGALGLNDLKTDTSGLRGMIANLESATMAGMEAKAKETAATYKTVDAMQALNAELANAPRMWRHALASSRAQDGQGSPFPGGGGGSSPPPGAGSGGGSAPAAPTIIVNSHDAVTTSRAVSRTVSDWEYRSSRRNRVEVP